jgi:opacity protein-like surface antigen
MRKWLLWVGMGIAGVAPAQSVELGLLIGGSLYSGDLSPKEFGVYFQEISPAGGVFGRFNVQDALSLRVGVSMGKIRGTGDTTATVIRQSFRSNITELALSAEVHPFSFGNDNFRVRPYVFGGVAGFQFNPQTQFDGSWIDLQALGTEGQGLPGYEAPYRLTQISLPFGGGIKFIVNDAWAIGLEFGWRATFTDYLDDISSTQVRYIDVYEGNGRIAAQVSNALIPGPESGEVVYKRGGEFRDWYHLGGVTLSYFLGGSSDYGGGSAKRYPGGRKRGKPIGCPTFR